MNELSDRMRAFAKTGHERAPELIAKADELDAKIAAHYAEDGNTDTAKSLLDAWARACRLWSECTGEPIV